MPLLVCTSSTINHSFPILTEPGLVVCTRCVFHNLSCCQKTDIRYDYSDDDVDDLSEGGFSYGGRPAGEGGARASGRGGSRKGPAAAAAAARANNDNDYLSDDEGLYDSDDLDGEGGDGSFDDYYDEDDDDDSFGADSFDEGYSNARASSGRRPPPPSRRGEGGQRRGGGPSRGGRGRGRRGPPAPARMERLKAKLADAQVGLKTKMTGVTHKGAKVMRELKVRPTVENKEYHGCGFLVCWKRFLLIFLFRWDQRPTV